MQIACSFFRGLKKENLTLQNIKIASIFSKGLSKKLNLLQNMKITWFSLMVLSNIPDLVLCFCLKFLTLWFLVFCFLQWKKRDY
jgi:hypothetical protein